MLVAAAGVVLAVLAVLTPLPWQVALLAFAAFTGAAAVLPDAAGAPERSAGRQPLAQGALQRLAGVLGALPDPAIALGRGGMILLYNDRAREHYERLRPGQHLSSLIRNPDLLDAVAAAERGAPAATIVYSERVPVGRRIAATVAPLPQGERGDDGPAVLICLRDLTEQELLTQMRADFIANASHELRTPLASLSGFIETLQGPARNDPEATERFLAIMARQARRMSRLIDDLLSLSRVEMSAHLAPTGRVDLTETVRHVVDSLEPVAQEAKVDLAFGPAPPAAVIRGERDEIVQVFQNLIQNAIKYGCEGGHVWVRIERLAATGTQGPRIAVAVEDDGCGIAPEHLPRLTERFYRVDVATSRDKGGTGLGLAIVKHVLNRHRAQLTIASEPGRGSTFTALFDEAAEPSTVDAAGASEKHLPVDK